MNDLISLALGRVAGLIECTYHHDEDGRTDQPGEYSGADIVEALCGIEDDVRAAIVEHEARRVVADLSRRSLETIVATLITKFDREDDGVSWDNVNVADCAYRMLEARGLV
jgi:hypothetical protein